MPDATPTTPAAFALDEQGRLHAPNERAAEMLGVADGDAVLGLFADVQPDGQRSAPTWAKRLLAAQPGLPQSFVWQFRRRDGTPVDALVEVEPGPGGVEVRLRELTAMRSAERALRDSQARLQQIVDHTAAAVFVKGLDGRYLWVNREFARLAGRRAGEIVGRSNDDLFPGAAAQRFREQDARVVATRAPMDTEEHFSVDGGERTYLKHKFPLLAADGQPQALCGILTDITQRKRVEDALRAAALAVSSAEGEDVFHELVRYLATILAVDVAFVAEFADESHANLRMLALILDGHFLRQFEYPVTGSPCAKVVGRAFRFVASGVRSEFPPGTLFEAKGLDSYAALPLVDGAGGSLGIIAVMTRRPMEDAGLTEAMLKIFAARAAAEIERRRALEALADSEASYRSIFAASADAIFVHDWDTGRILDVSRAAEKLYGWSPEELKHLAVEDISAADEGYTQARALEQLERAKAGENIRFEWRVRHRSGTRGWHEVRIKPATIAGKKRLLAYTRDISATKAAEEALRTSEKRYRQLFELASDAILVTDAATLDLLDANHAAVELWGYERDELLRMKATDLSAEPEATRSALQGEAGTLSVPRRWHRRKDGTTFQVEITLNRFELDGRRIVISAIRDVTERREREEALAHSEAQYRAIFNASADALILWDSQYRRVDVNPAYEAMYGWSRDEVVGRGYDEPGYTRDYARPRYELLRRALAGETARAELEAIRKNGERIQTEVVTIPFRHRGEPHVLAIARDITERKRAEAALRSSEEQYRAIFNASTDALILFDSRYRCVEANPAYERMYGWSPEEVVGRGYAELGYDADYAKPRHELLCRSLAGETARAELEAVGKDGRRLYTDVVTIPFRHRGEPHVLAITRDITERKRAEQALRDSEEQYRAIFNASADALMLWNERLERVDVNPAHQKIFGFAREEVVGRGFEGLSYPEEYVRPRIEMVRRALAGEPSRAELEAIRKDGQHIFTELRTIPFHHRGEPRVLQVARDITERRRADEERARLEAQLRQAQKMEALGHLTGGIAHDFNNLLTSILGYIALSAERDAVAADSRLARYLEQARASCGRARDLIQQMLTFSRGQRGERRAVALAPLVDEAVKLLRASFPASIRLETVLDEHVSAVMADPVQLDQVLMNLAINARDAMDGTGRIAVRVASARHEGAECASCRKACSGDYVALEVGDDGPGIPAAVRERMFEPFFSTKAVGRGSGMGLATVHGIVHDLGGHVLVASVPGRGSTFTVLLPAIGREADAVPRPGTLLRAPQPPLAGRVLVVEDEASVAAFMRDLLESWSLAVTVASNPAAALDRFRSDPAAFDAVITDQTMPGMTGLALASELAKLKPALPVVLYTGYGERITRAMLDAAGVRELVAKPVEPDVAYAALAAVLPRRDASAPLS